MPGLEKDHLRPPDFPAATLGHCRQPSGEEQLSLSSSPLPTCVDSHVVLVIGGAGEAPPAVGLWTHVRTLARVRSDVNLADVGGGKRAATALKRALEGTLTCVDRAQWMRAELDRSCWGCPGHPYPSAPPKYYTNETSDQSQLEAHCLYQHWHL